MGEDGFHLKLEALSSLDCGGVLIDELIENWSYGSKAGAQTGIESVRTNAPEDARCERNTAKTGQHMFNLKAANHEVIGTGKTYTTAGLETMASHPLRMPESDGR